MTAKHPIVAVTGLNATDNPGPGIAVIRSLRMAPGFSGHIVGLAYDSLDPGVYAADLVDDVFLIPYPRQGVDELDARLAYVQERVGLDVILPTLDAELPLFMQLEPTLAERGVRVFLPSRDQFASRGKDQLAQVGELASVQVPATCVVADVGALYQVHDQVPYPFYVKGQHYGARLVRTLDEAIVAFHATAAEWGLPILIQAHVEGEEVNVAAIGDGNGGVVGAVAMKKTYVTDKGKGWAGIAIKDPELLTIARRIVSKLQWRGACEVEVIRDRAGDYHLIEVNPRFPSWVFLTAAAGMNLPYALLELALGHEVAPMSDYEAGTMFVRIAIDQIASLADFQSITTSGEILRGDVR